MNIFNDANKHFLKKKKKTTQKIPRTTESTSARMNIFDKQTNFWKKKKTNKYALYTNYKEKKNKKPRQVLHTTIQKK